MSNPADTPKSVLEQLRDFARKYPNISVEPPMRIRPRFETDLDAAQLIESLRHVDQADRVVEIVVAERRYSRSGE